MNQANENQQSKVELTPQELDVLFEAVELWEQEGCGCNSLGASLLESMVGEEGREKIAKKREECKAKMKLKKERGVVLRAKLITMRDSLAASQLFDEASKNAV